MLNLSTLSKELLPQLTTRLQMAVGLAQEKGSSSWLTALPVQEHGFSLHKTAFQDALALRYGWLPTRTPSGSLCMCMAVHSLLIMHCHVQRVGFPQYDTMR